MAIFDKLKGKSDDEDFMNIPTEGIGAPAGALGPAGNPASSTSVGLPSPATLPSTSGTSASSQMQLINKIDILTNKVDTLISEIEVLKQKLAQIQPRQAQQPQPQPQPQQDTTGSFGGFQTQQPQQQQQPSNWQSPW